METAYIPSPDGDGQVATLREPSAEQKQGLADWCRDSFCYIAEKLLTVPRGLQRQITDAGIDHPSRARRQLPSGSAILLFSDEVGQLRSMVAEYESQAAERAAATERAAAAEDKRDAITRAWESEDTAALDRAFQA